MYFNIRLKLNLLLKEKIITLFSHSEIGCNYTVTRLEVGPNGDMF